MKRVREMDNFVPDNSEIIIYIAEDGQTKIDVLFENLV
jgi:hypothetical protein